MFMTPNTEMTHTGPIPDPYAFHTVSGSYYGGNLR